MARALRLLHFLIVILSIKNLSLAQNNGSNEFIYNGFRQENLQTDGNAKIHRNGLLQLTNTSKQVKGHAFYPRPFQFKSSSSPSISSSNSSFKYLSFSTNFVLAMVPELQNLSGHGMAFVISPSMDFSEVVASQYLGLFNPSNNGVSSNHIFAVEFDTILSPDLSDINDNHVGIDVNGLVSMVSAPVSYYFRGKNQIVKFIGGYPLQVWIDYDEDEKLLNVTVAPTDIPKPIRPLISTEINLSSILLDYMYVGFSAATGTLASDHYVLGWSFNKSGLSENLQISDLPSIPRIKRSRQVVPISITITIVAVVISGIIVAYVTLILRFGRRTRVDTTRRGHG